MTHIEGPPETLPLNDVFSLKSWRPPEFEFFSEPLAKRIRPNQDRAQILVCHDLAGGYHDDRFLEGTMNSDAYIFSYWHLIDTFVYFSHHFVTIPPISWINSAHRHGVVVLGTLITEWKAGYQIWKEILSSSLEAQNVLIQQLSDIMMFYGFDGWLINVENTIDVDEIPLLVNFVRKLTSVVETHRPKYGKVIWYDSVTVEGKLEWQNELNSKNSSFFDVSHGIFLNYAWKPETNLERSITVAAENDRIPDVFVGVDIFGRGCYGGGGWNTREAVDQAVRRGMSVALFAQGWVYEKFPKRNLILNQKRFWDLLRPSLYKEQIVQFLLPFFTSFDHGRGKIAFINGRRTFQCYGFKLNRQQFQAFIPDFYQSGECKPSDDIFCKCCETTKMSDYYDYFSELCIEEMDAFDGGSCQKIIIQKDPNDKGETITFVPCRWQLNIETEWLKLLLIFKKSLTDFEFILKMKTDRSDLWLFPFNVNSYESECAVSSDVFDSVDQVKNALESFPINIVKEDDIFVDSGKKIAFINSWEVRVFRIPCRKFSISEFKSLGLQPYTKDTFSQSVFWLKLGFLSLVEC